MPAVALAGTSSALPGRHHPLPLQDDPEHEQAGKVATVPLLPRKRLQDSPKQVMWCAGGRVFQGSGCFFKRIGFHAYPTCTPHPKQKKSCYIICFVGGMKPQTVQPKIGTSSSLISGMNIFRVEWQEGKPSMPKNPIVFSIIVTTKWPSDALLFSLFWEGFPFKVNQPKKRFFPMATGHLSNDKHHKARQETDGVHLLRVNFCFPGQALDTLLRRRGIGFADWLSSLCLRICVISPCWFERESVTTGNMFLSRGLKQVKVV